MNDPQLTRLLRNQVARYRVASVDLLISELPVEKRDPARKLLKSDIAFQTIHGLTGGGAICQRRRKPPAKIVISRCIAIHQFCRASTIKRTLLMKQEVKRYFPNLFRKGLPAGYYVDANGEKPVLGMLRVDVQLTPIRRIWQRSVALTEKHRTQTEFRKLIASKQFEITWLVPTDSKANTIRRVGFTNQHASYPVNADTIPFLLDQLIPPPKTLPDVAGL